jgi:hypothetical protein
MSAPSRPMQGPIGGRRDGGMTGTVRRMMGAVIATAVLAFGAASAGAAPASGAGFPYCSWWTETTAETMNVALPDTGAAYWTTPFKAEPGLRIRSTAPTPTPATCR